MKKLMEISPDVKEQLEAEDKFMNILIEKENFPYSGTDILSDAKRSHRDTMQKNLTDDTEDPFKSFGHGIQSYFILIETLIKVLSVCSLLFLPVIYQYYNGAVYNDTGGLGALLGRFTMGNLGHSETFCEHSYFSLGGVQRLECNKGNISKIKAYGLMPEGKGSFTNNWCGPFDKFKEIKDCTDAHLNTPKFLEDFAK